MKAIRILAYLKGTPELGPTWFTTDGPKLIASCDAAFAVHSDTGGSKLSVSFRIGQAHQDLPKSHAFRVQRVHYRDGKNQVLSHLPDLAWLSSIWPNTA
jgi:hypothetical protein